MVDLPGSYEFSSETARMDRALIHAWMSEQAYWALGRSRAGQDAAIDASRNYGIFTGAGDQVAYARAVTDGVTFAWLCDVFVDPSTRGAELGKALVDAACADLDELGIRRTVLVTGSAHGLYDRFEFGAVDPPENWMVRFRPDLRAR
jgi:GNAT superfamily N-acetyltransferase